MLHTVLGVCKLLITGFLEDVNSPYYLGNKKRVNIINNRISKIKPPSTINRKPIPIDMHKSYKASDYLYFLEYYSLYCFKYILPLKYYNHFAHFVSAISLLNNRGIDACDLINAKNHLNNFV